MPTIQLMTTWQAMQKLIELSCVYDVSEGAPSIKFQRQFFSRMMWDMRMLVPAYEYLHGMREDMPRVHGLCIVDNRLTCAASRSGSPVPGCPSC